MKDSGFRVLNETVDFTFRTICYACLGVIVVGLTVELFICLIGHKEISDSIAAMSVKGIYNIVLNYNSPVTIIAIALIIISKYISTIAEVISRIANRKKDESTTLDEEEEEKV